MRHAHYEIWPEEGAIFGTIPGFQGVWAKASTVEECRQELQEVLEEWLIFRIANHLPLPTVDGQELVIPQVA